MGLFSRIRDLVTGSANNALDKMENPEAMLNQYLRDMEIEIHNSETALIKLMAAEKIVEQQYITAGRTAKVREEQAMTALTAGDEGLAQRAIADKHVWDENATELQAQLIDAMNTRKRFTEELTVLKDEHRRMLTKRASIVSRHQFAQASNRIHKTMSKVSSGGAIANFERISDRVTQLEAEANARIHLREAIPNIDTDIKKLRINAAVEMELSALRAKLQPAQ